MRITPSIINVLGYGYLLRNLPWYGEPTLFSEYGRSYVIAETGHTSKSNDIRKEYLKYSVIDTNKIVTYKSFNNVVFVRNKHSNRIEVVCKASECPEDIKHYISLIRKHIKLEEKTRLVEKIIRLRSKVRLTN